MSKKVIVTGKSGFIGFNLFKKLNELGFNASSLDDSYLSFNSWEEKLLEILNQENPDVIFHVGACSNTLEDDANYMMVRNYESTKILTNWAKKNKKPLIYSSSAACYGTNNRYPSNLYGWSKYAAEDYVVLNGGIALRYFNVYGNGESHKDKMASVAYQMTQKFKNNEKIKLFPLNPKRDFVYIKDIISANVFALENYEKLQGNFYEVGSGEARPFEDIMNILKIPFSYHEESSIPNGYQFYTCSDKNKWMPKWKPEWNLEKGLQDYNLLKT